MNDLIVRDIVADWDEVYKKGQLTLWVLLAVADGEKYAQDIVRFMDTHTGGTLSVKEQSLYRALRRFVSLRLVTVTKRSSPESGPDRKYYALTPRGTAVLAEFARMNIRPLQSPAIIAIITNLKES